MTNYEKVLKENPVFKDCPLQCVADVIGVVGGKAISCDSITCQECAFDGIDCSIEVREWLEKDCD